MLGNIVTLKWQLGKNFRPTNDAINYQQRRRKTSNIPRYDVCLLPSIYNRFYMATKIVLSRSGL